MEVVGEVGAEGGHLLVGERLIRPIVYGDYVVVGGGHVSLVV